MLGKICRKGSVMKTRRHAKILELIKEYDLETQDELLRFLREAGYDVTQIGRAHV